MPDDVNNASTTTRFLPQLRRLAGTAQFYWFLSHVFAIFFMILATVTSIFKGNTNASAVRSFQLSITSIIITYLIVIRQTYKSKPITFIFSQLFTLIGDDNVQYLLLAAVIRFFASTIYGGINTTVLQPFTIFALFHSLSYFQTVILPFIPFSSPASRQLWSNRIQNFVKKYNETFLMIAANMELMMCFTYAFQLVVSVLTTRILRPSFFAQNLKTICLCASYIVFCKFRFVQSKYMQTLVTSYDTRFNQFIYGSPLVPAGVKNVLAELRGLLVMVLSRIELPRGAKKTN
ncbi:DEKNAAC104222 [Brettanomyces naardenensis]|uniref:DEKNAAC104222 n=1 Tax=Brettanomyces naardenensis TaxID=13370 RepID=A0A448YQ17_BRENA|nr:DEKNAAC104222 [Brettanomyces naardenensis]